MKRFKVIFEGIATQNDTNYNLIIAVKRILFMLSLIIFYDSVIF
jgi:hypothetical protein